ncbi:MAG: hypothetical protein FGM57_01925 [Candidatus Taylorbacteria bacterium]|nr:hypothetical protein [Candidatus Taylorbacteria bacterium]
MNTSNLIHADIFFFITAISVVLLTIILIVILFYIARAVKTISQMVEKIKTESDQVIDDLSDLREKIKDGGSQLTGMSKWILTMLFGKAAAGIFSGKTKKTTKKAKTEDDGESQ